MVQSNGSLWSTENCVYVHIFCGLLDVPCDLQKKGNSSCTCILKTCYFSCRASCAVLSCAVVEFYLRISEGNWSRNETAGVLESTYRLPLVSYRRTEYR